MDDNNQDLEKDYQNQTNQTNQNEPTESAEQNRQFLEQLWVK